jgi:hypothetical protein
MIRTASGLLAAAFILSATAACTGPASAPPAVAEGPAQAACDAEAVRWAVGETAGEDVVERARREAGARTVRVLSPGTAATMDFNPLRLNLVTDEGMRITEVRCG